ncbi:glycine cleavage system protein GcvH [Radicibacter daui]|uniref:glycine cleavage system protein GcvH n=1 Tax=Radicibacter daui TaxID=3064829 RepID=UPI004046B160
MATLKFSKDHEWISVEGTTARVGITHFAQEQLGDVVFVDLPAVGTALTEGGDAAVVESVKAASDVYAPVDGEVTAANADLADTPDLVNTDPMGKGWFFEMTLSNPAQLDGLMDEAQYKAMIGE